MSDADRALLPEGLHDDLPPAAEHEAAVIAQLLQIFRNYGYARVKPPLIEFEESLLAGPGQGLARHMFRLMDPISQRMMGLRADMTTQVARIATSRLSEVPRPLRLYYSGQVLRVRGNQLRPERQYTQAGVELIGIDTPAADAEIILLAVDALETVGVEDLSVDLTTPVLGTLLVSAMGLDETAAAAVRRALDQKDAAAINAFDQPIRDLLKHLTASAGSVEGSLAHLQSLELPDGEVKSCQALIARLAVLVALLQDARPELILTVDPGESRGFAYQTGVCFTLFAKGARGELGRGGRYQLENGESATGFTYYLDSVARTAPLSPGLDVVYVPFACEEGTARRLRSEGKACLRGLSPEADASSSARDLGCSHIFLDSAIQALGSK